MCQIPNEKKYGICLWFIHLVGEKKNHFNRIGISALVLIIYMWLVAYLSVIIYYVLTTICSSFCKLATYYNCHCHRKKFVLNHTVICLRNIWQTSICWKWNERIAQPNINIMLLCTMFSWCYIFLPCLNALFKYFSIWFMGWSVDSVSPLLKFIFIHSTWHDASQYYITTFYKQNKSDTQPGTQRQQHIFSFSVTLLWWYMVSKHRLSYKSSSILCHTLFKTLRFRWII